MSRCRRVISWCQLGETCHMCKSQVSTESEKLSIASTTPVVTPGITQHRLLHPLLYMRRGAVVGNVEVCTVHGSQVFALPETWGELNHFYRTTNIELLRPRPHCRTLIEGLGMRNFGLTRTEKATRALKNIISSERPQRTLPVMSNSYVSLHVYRNGR